MPFFGISWGTKSLDLERDLSVLQDVQLVAGDAFEQLFVVEHLDEPVDGGVTRLVRNGYGQVDGGPHVLIQALEQSAAAREYDTAVIDVGRDLRPQLGQRVFD